MHTDDCCGFVEEWHAALLVMYYGKSAAPVLIPSREASSNENWEVVCKLLVIPCVHVYFDEKSSLKVHQEDGV